MFSPEDLRSWEENDRKNAQRTLRDRVGSSEDRFKERLEAFRSDGKPAPELRHWTLWVLHNCVVHPLLGLIPSVTTVQFHDLTSAWLNQRQPRLEHPRVLQERVPLVKDRPAWLFHNCIAHMAIGVYPVPLMFDLHDWSADRMNLPGWV